VLDVTDAAQLAAAAKDVGQLSGLISNAGVTFAGPIEHLRVDRLREQLEVNVVGLVAATQAFLPAIRAGRGRVVVIGSTAGQVAIPFLGTNMSFQRRGGSPNTKGFNRASSRLTRV
jgi:NADP-dependent 3-hydroxy acid dehydrogenase YdfG